MSRSAGSPCVRTIDGEYSGKRELPVLGEVGAPAPVLVRPDGYVAWVGKLTDSTLPDALTYRFGRPPEAHSRKGTPQWPDAESAREGTRTPAGLFAGLFAVGTLAAAVLSRPRGVTA